MRSSSLNLPPSIGLLRSAHHRLSSSASTITRLDFCSPLKESIIQKNGLYPRRYLVRPRCFSEVSFDDWVMDDMPMDYVVSSSDDEGSDSEILLTPLNDVDMPSFKKQFVTSEDALTATAHRITYGFVTNMGLITFLILLLALVDWCAWKIVRLPLKPFYFTRPFIISGLLVASAGYICIPLLKKFKICKNIETQVPVRRSKKRTPTMGGLFLVPIGVAVATYMAGISSTEVSGAVIATSALAAIGLLDDSLVLMKDNKFGLSSQARFFLEVAVAVLFSFWLDSSAISSPYGMKMLLVPLPEPLGLVNLGKCYLLLSSVCFVSMGYGVNLTDGLDGLAAGTSALAFIGMSIAVLPINPNLSVFGASMAGACVGFLLHNQYHASVFMGNIGSLALGGALAAMASCTGMFFPLFIASGIFVLESLSAFIQVLSFKMNKLFHGTRTQLFRVLPLHYVLLLYRIREPLIVAGAYVISFGLSLLAGYVGLLSA
ncbi:hypothetical protein V2J09_010031 [Rumex salicifolius]